MLLASIECPKDCLNREEAPQLFTFIDQVAAAAGAPTLRALIVDAAFNATFRKAGLRRSSVVTIGLPLWTVLDPQERVALLSHEFAHGLNHDSLTLGFVGQAIRTLLRLGYILKPDFSDMISMILSPVMALISGTFNRLAYLLVILSWQRSQEAEFLADFTAGKIAGTAAATSLLRKTRNHIYMQPALDPIHLSTDWTQHNFFPLFREFVRNLPPSELERSRRAFDRTTFEANATHPPNWARVQFLERHRSAGTFRADPALVAAGDAELAKLERRLTGILLAMFYPGH